MGGRLIYVCVTNSPRSSYLLAHPSTNDTANITHHHVAALKKVEIQRAEKFMICSAAKKN